MKKKNLVQLFALAIMPLFTSSCIVTIDGVVGKGSIVSENREVQNFSSIKLMSSAQVEVYKGSELKVTLSDYENMLSYWDIEVVNNNLLIKTKTFTSLLNSRAKVIIEMPVALYSATLAGSGNVEIKDAFDELNEILISGSGNFIAANNGQYNNLNITISGSGNVNLTGSVQNLVAKIAGSGDMNLNNLVAQDAYCSVFGSGNMYLNVEKNLKATIAGSGDIVYSGNPTLDFSGFGSGKLRKN